MEQQYFGIFLYENVNKRQVDGVEWIKELRQQS